MLPITIGLWSNHVSSVAIVVRKWHYPEVFTGARHDRYRRQTRRSVEIIDSAEFDPGSVKTLEAVARGRQKNRACGLDEFFPERSTPQCQMPESGWSH
jgi:hypothetical protein